MVSEDTAPPGARQRIEELIDAGELDAAQQALRAATDDELGAGDRELLAGLLAAAHEDLTGALGAFRRAAKLAPEDPAPVVHTADALLRLGRKRRARLLLWKMTRKRDDPVLWSGRAELEFAINEPGRAASSLSRALARAPDNREYLSGRVFLLRRLRRYDEAREELAEASARLPDDADLLAARGAVELDDQQLEAAAELFARAREKDPADRDVARAHAVSIRLLGRYAAAQGLLEQTIGEDPDTAGAELLVELAVVRFFRGFPLEAEQLCRRALALEPGNESAASNVAWLMERQGRLDDALQCIRDALSHAPGSQALLLRAAGIAHDLHDYTAAEDYYKQALEIGPDPTASKALRWIRWRVGKLSVLASLLGAIERETRRRFNAERPVLALLDELVTGEGPLPRSLKARATRLAWRRARVEAVLTRLVPANWFLFGSVIGVMLWLSPVVVGSGHGEHPEVLRDVGVTVLYVLALALGYALTTWAIAPGRRSSFLVRLVACAFVPTVFAAVLLRLRGDIPDRVDLPILWASVAFGAAFIFELLFFLAIVGTERFALRRLRRDDPYAAAVTALVSALVQLRTGVDPVDRSEVRSVVSALEDAAAGLQDHLRGLEPTGDLRSDAWLSGRADGIAAAVRDLKSWVLSPGPESFDALKARIEHNVKSVGNGYWRDLEWVDPAAAAASARRLRITTTVRNVVMATLPLVGVLVAESVGILDGTTANQLLLAAVTWAIVSLLITFDPSFAEKLTAFKDARAAMKEGGGKSSGTA